MSKMRWFGVAVGHSRSLKIAPFHRAHTSSYILAPHSNYVPLLHRFCDIARYWSKTADLNLPHVYLVPPLVVALLEFRRDF